MPILSDLICQHCLALCAKPIWPFMPTTNDTEHKKEQFIDEYLAPTPKT